jgi:hypothetical protein
MKQTTYGEMVGLIEKAYIIHRNFEPNVLWIENSSDMPNQMQAYK